MKSSACLFALTLMFFSGYQQQMTGKPLDALREIGIERDTKLTLGGSMPQPADFCDWKGLTCFLKARTFGGAKTMSLRKTESGLISEFNFNYGVMSEDQVRAQIDEYTKLLGKPAGDTRSSTNRSNVHVLTWSDSSTSFELSYRTVSKATEGSAKLFDKALVGPTH